MFAGYAVDRGDDDNNEDEDEDEDVAGMLAGGGEE